MNTTSLWALPEGGQCELQKFAPTLPENYRIRLEELGFHPGEKLHCLNAPRLGAPKVYRVSNTIYSLDKLIAERLFISNII